MKKFFYLTMALVALLEVQNIYSMAADLELDDADLELSFDDSESDFDLDFLWERSFWRVIDKSKFVKAKRMLSYLDKPERTLNAKNDRGDTPLMAIFKQSVKSGIQPFKLIEFVLDKYKNELDLNVQDAQGNTFFMNVLHNYNDHLRKFKNDETVSMLSRWIIKLILESDIIRSKLDLDLKNNLGETTRDIAKAVKLEPELAKLIDVDTSPRKSTIKDVLGSFADLGLRTVGAIHSMRMSNIPVKEEKLRV